MSNRDVTELIYFVAVTDCETKLCPCNLQLKKIKKERNRIAGKTLKQNKT